MTLITVAPSDIQKGDTFLDAGGSRVWVAQSDANNGPNHTTVVVRYVADGGRGPREWDYPTAVRLSVDREHQPAPPAPAFTGQITTPAPDAPTAALNGLALYVHGVVEVTQIPEAAGWSALQHTQNMLCDLARALRLTDSNDDEVALEAIMDALADTEPTT